MILALQVVLGFLPSFTWLFFYLQEDIHPQPKRLVALAFVNGAAFAFLAILIQFGIKSALTSLGVGNMSVLWLLLFAATEEILKFAAAYAAVHKSPDFDHPVDAMVYAIVAALGFAAVENIGVLIGGNPGTMVLANVFHIVTFRFIGATLLHTLSSGLVGYYWALSVRRWGAKRYLVWGLALATVLHTAFNYAVLHYQEMGLSVAFLMIVAFFVLADFEKLKASVV